MSNKVSQQQPRALTVDEALQQAIAHHKEGQLQDAERLYRAILQSQPNHPDANHNLGVLAVQIQKPDVALLHFKAALDANPNQGQYWLSYIDALILSGQFSVASQMLKEGRQRGLQGVAVEALAERLEDGLMSLGESTAQESHNSRDSSPATSVISRNIEAKNRRTRLTKSARKPVPPEGESPDPQELSTLMALFNMELYTEASNLAQTLTVRFPLYGFGWKVLGAAMKQMGRTSEALIPMQKAVVLLPKDPDAHSNLGNTLQDLGQLDEAVASYHEALKIKLDFAEAHNNLGSALRALGQIDGAVTSFCQALKIKPDFAEAYNNLGNALKDLGKLDAAVASCSQALKIKPYYANAQNNLGNALQVLGQLNEAVASYREALKINPDFAEAHSNLGSARRALGQLDDAVTSYRQALMIKPDYAEAHSNLGNALAYLGQLDAAVASSRQALKIKPDFAEAHSNLGNALTDLGQLDAAVASYRQALKIKPDYAEAHSNLLFTQNYLLDQSPIALLDEARRFGDLVARQSLPYTTWRNVPESERYLRVGLVSADLRLHPVGFFVEGMLEALASNAANRIEIMVYSNHFIGDALTDRVKSFCHKWHSVAGLSDESLAHLIRDDGIDILIDLSGHTAHNRLPIFAWRAAPVQASWLGYFATTGVPAIDYLIADPWTLPETEETYFTEKIWRLPETRLCFTPPDTDVKVAPLPALSNGYITFGCFNNLTKMNDAVVSLWVRVLASVPDSRLFLKAKQLKTVSVRRSVLERFADCGISSERLILEGPESRAEYLAAYQRVDIALDPFPFTGGTTSVEGLWMGVPVLTLAGERFVSLQGVSLLMNAGLPEWIATNPDDYVARVVLHSADLPRLAVLRNGLRRQVLASPIFDAPRFARHFEAALRGMWRKWCNARS